MRAIEKTPCGLMRPPSAGQKNGQPPPGAGPCIAGQGGEPTLFRSRSDAASPSAGIPARWTLIETP